MDESRRRRAERPFVGPSVRLLGAPTADGRDAATVILVSDRPDLHVLMLERTHRAVFAPGATVFPGGAVDRRRRGRRAGADRRPRRSRRERRAGYRQRRARIPGRGLRECFEEAGILLARDAGPAGPSITTTPSRRPGQLNAGEPRLRRFARDAGLVLDARELRVFSHWLTPVGAPRRYNTWFFVAPAPDGEEGTHDDSELVASAWMRPADALAQHADGEIDLIFPTEMSLARSPATTARRVARRLDACRPTRRPPRVVGEGNGERVALPHDAGAADDAWTIPLPDIPYRAERSPRCECALIVPQ